MIWIFRWDDDAEGWIALTPDEIKIESVGKPFSLINGEFHWLTVGALMHDMAIELGVKE